MDLAALASDAPLQCLKRGPGLRRYVSHFAAALRQPTEHIGKRCCRAFAFAGQGFTHLPRLFLQRDRHGQNRAGLLFGLLGAIVLVYLLIVVNFQSWSDPFVIITALPAALAGIVWMLFATHTTLSVPALTGAIMCMGVATANSVLVISFAREKLDELGDATKAALEAGFVRLRPVLMTALAMVIGMLPMALGLGEGGEQNAPLGRAVIGGLILATVSTLFFVPVVFSIVHRHFKGQPAAAADPSLGGIHVPA